MKPISSDNRTSHKKTIIHSIIVLLLLLCAYFAYTLGSMFSPARITEDVFVEIPEGYSVSQTAILLEERNVIRSATGMKIMNRIDQLSVKSGVYKFDEGLHSLPEVRQRLHTADYGDVFVIVTIPEGSNRQEIADIIERSDLEVTATEFLSLSSGMEGYLFPDTYFFLPNATAQEIVDELTETFNEKTEDINTSQRSFDDIVTMASIVEKESGSDPVEMATVAGILWKRIDKGMPLQVDAPFLFTQGKTSAQLTTSDLRADGPYNTYTRRGLTPTPIGNPGLQALEATVNPIESVYFFYLHDNNGGIHYGVTHDDHVRNKNTYLR